MSEIRVNIAQRRVRVEMRNGTTWNGISGKPEEYPPEDHSHVVADISDFPETIPAAPHTHDDRYYTETETDQLLAGKAASAHTHDDRYYTETEIDNLDEIQFNLVNSYRL